MINKFYKTLFLFFVPLVICTCENPWMAEIVQEKTITFNSMGGTPVSSQKLYRGERITKPSPPRKDDCNFLYWYKNNENEKWDFDIIPTHSMTLYAYWNPTQTDPIPTDPIPTDPTPTFTDSTQLAEFLADEDDNTSETPYKVKLNVSANEIIDIKKVLDREQNKNKYVSLDLSGSQITNISDYAFCECETLTGVTLPNGVTSIGEQAFYSCGHLTSVTLPDGVTTIGERAFSDCYNLTSINIPNSVTTIGDGAFTDCQYLTSINIPNGVTCIGNFTFASCFSLTSVTLPDGVTTIGDNAFAGCSSLTNITIPNNVTSIGTGAFHNCPSLTAINVNSANTAYKTVDGVLYDKDISILIQYPTGKKGIFTIPNTVTSIQSQAFANCASLTSITIPTNVKINSLAFEKCTDLTSVTFQGTITSGDFSNYLPFMGDLRDKFYATNNTGTPGTYTTTAPVTDNSVWTKN